jgi:hypothetical protein
MPLAYVAHDMVMPVVMGGPNHCDIAESDSVLGEGIPELLANRD